MPSRKPLVAQREVLARTLASQSKSHIAREMGIDRETVTRIQESHNLPQLLADSKQHIVESVVPDAISSVHAQIKDKDSPGDGNLGIRLLEGIGILGADQGKVTYQFNDDARLQVAIAELLPAPPTGPAPVQNSEQEANSGRTSCQPVDNKAQSS